MFKNSKYLKLLTKYIFTVVLFFLIWYLCSYLYYLASIDLRGYVRGDSTWGLSVHYFLRFYPLLILIRYLLKLKRKYKYISFAYDFLTIIIFSFLVYTEFFDTWGTPYRTLFIFIPSILLSYLIPFLVMDFIPEYLKMKKIIKNYENKNNE